MIILKFSFRIIIRVAIGVIMMFMINRIAEQQEKISFLIGTNEILRSKAGFPKEVPFIQSDRNNIKKKKVYEL